MSHFGINCSNVDAPEKVPSALDNVSVKIKVEAVKMSRQN